MTPRHNPVVQLCAKLSRTVPHRPGHSNAGSGTFLVYFGHPHTTNGLTEAINDCLENLSGSTPDCQNLSHYMIQALLETSGFNLN